MRTVLDKLKSGKTGLIIVGLVVLWALWMGVSWLTDRPANASPATTPSQPDAGGFELANSSARRVAGFVESYEPKIEETAAEVAELKKALDTSTQQLESLRKRDEEKTTLIRRLLVELENDKRERKAAQDARRADESVAMKMADPLRAALPRDIDTRPAAQLQVALEPPSRIQGVDLDLTQDHGPRDVHLPAGSFAEGVILTGVFAPVQGQAMPIKIRLTSAFQAPNRARIPLGDAFIIGKATGDANSQRAIVQLETLSYVHHDGRAVELGLNGFISDHDGVQGASGKYVWRAAEFATYSAVAGGISGAADAVATNQTVTQVTPLGGSQQIIAGDILKFAGGRGVSRAADALNEVIVDRLDEIVPAIWVPNGRPVTVTLIEGVSLKGVKREEISDEAAGMRPFRGLDFDR